MIQNGSLTRFIVRDKGKVNGTMPKGPNGQTRPADTNACAVNVARIATGEAEDTKNMTNRAKSGRAGAAARAQKLNAAERTEIAKKAAEARWAE